MEKKDFVKDGIIELLKSTNRNGMDKLIDKLTSAGFFESPASTKYHGCYEGGLAEHSHNVYTMLIMKDDRLKLKTPRNSMIIAALLHDVCKAGAYIGDKAPYQFNREHPKGHAVLSIQRIQEYIELTELEDKMIRYHMGIYGLKEFQDPGKEHRGEYWLREKGMANAWYHYPIVKVMYFCDELISLEEKANEGR